MWKHSEAQAQRGAEKQGRGEKGRETEGQRGTKARGARHCGLHCGCKPQDAGQGNGAGLLPRWRRRPNTET